MLALAFSPEGASGRAIAQSQNLPGAYLEQLMIRLRNAQLVVAMRGAKGKFLLARPAEEITLADIVEALEGPIQIAECADVPNCCAEPSVCALQEVFAAASQTLRDYLNGITLAAMAEKQRALEKSGIQDFHI